MNKFIDPKNPHTVGKSAWNLGNHTLSILFVLMDVNDDTSIVSVGGFVIDFVL